MTDVSELCEHIRLDHLENEVEALKSLVMALLPRAMYQSNEYLLVNSRYGSIQAFEADNGKPWYTDFILRLADLNI